MKCRISKIAVVTGQVQARDGIFDTHVAFDISTIQTSTTGKFKCPAILSLDFEVVKTTCLGFEFNLRLDRNVESKVEKSGGRILLNKFKQSGGFTGSGESKNFDVVAVVEESVENRLLFCSRCHVVSMMLVSLSHSL